MVKHAIFPDENPNIHRQRHYAGHSIRPVYNTFIADDEFHSFKQNLAKNQVMDRVRIDKQNELHYLTGGTRNQLLKPQPQGSFMRMSTTSGNNVYGQQNGFRGAGGSFRTQEGQEYGIRILKRRGKQLEELAQANELGIPMAVKERTAVLEPKPRDGDEIAFGLLLTELEDVIFAGNYENIDLGNLRKAYAISLNLVLSLGLQTLENYFSRLNDIVSTIRDFMGGDTYREDLNERERQKVLTSANFLIRIRALFRLAIASINKSPNERKKFLTSFSRQIIRTKDFQSIDQKMNEQLERLERIPNFVKRTAVPQFNIEEFDVSDDDETRGLRPPFPAEDTDEEDERVEDEWLNPMTRLDELTTTTSGTRGRRHGTINPQRFETGDLPLDTNVIIARPTSSRRPTGARFSRQQLRDMKLKRLDDITRSFPDFPYRPRGQSQVYESKVKKADRFYDYLGENFPDLVV